MTSTHGGESFLKPRSTSCFTNLLPDIRLQIYKCVSAGSRVIVSKTPRSWKVLDLKIDTSLPRTCRLIYSEAADIHYDELAVNIRGRRVEEWQEIPTQPVFQNLVLARRIQLQLPGKMSQVIMKDAKVFELLKNLRFLEFHCFAHWTWHADSNETILLENMEQSLIGR
jgi:hypothetical protein